jgi:dipeptidyl aminopeptidase/acylaminoacyl peptidase
LGVRCLRRRSSVFSAAVVVGLLMVLAPVAQAAAGRIAFLNDRTRSAQVWQIDPSSGAVEQLTFDLTSQPPALKYSPAWSSDGKWLAFVSEASADGVGHLFHLSVDVMRPDGSGRHRVAVVRRAGSGDLAFAWAPRGQRVAVVAAKGAEGTITIVDVGTGRTRVTRYRTDLSLPRLSWAPGGSQLALDCLHGLARPDVCAVNVSGLRAGRMRLLRRNAQNPLYSPDPAAAQIAYQCVDADYRTRPCLMTGSGRELAHRIDPRSSIVGWDPRGTDLVVARQGRQWSSLTRVSPRTGRSVQLARARGYVRFDTAWAPDGSKLALAKIREIRWTFRNRSLLVVNRAGKLIRRLATGPGLTSAPAWQPTRQR